MAISLEDAQSVIAGAHEHARGLGVAVAVAIVDEGGQLLALARMDNAFPLSAQIAEAKAHGAALWHRDGASLRAVQQERPAFFEVVSGMTRIPLVPALGSALIRRDGHVLGAVGVSGATSEVDLECAEAGLRLL